MDFEHAFLVNIEIKEYILFFEENENERDWDFWSVVYHTIF